MKKFVKVVSLACASAMLLSTTAFADGDAFKVGGIGPVTGGAAVYGQAVKKMKGTFQSQHTKYPALHQYEAFDR